MNYNRRAAVVGGLVSAAAFHFGTGLEPLWPLAWVAPFPVLAIAYRTSTRLAVVTALGAWCLGYLAIAAFLGRTLHVPLPIVAVTVGIPGLVFVGTMLVSRALLHRGAPFAAALAFPALWVSFELLLARTSPHGTAGSVAYS